MSLATTREGPIPKSCRCRDCGRPTWGAVATRGGRCRQCAKSARLGEREVTGKAREKLLRDFSTWLYENPDPWQRAQSGLMMAVPHDPTTCRWP